MIRIPQVRVIDEEGNQLGVMPTPRALQLAQERGYDLVEVAPMSSPPVTRLLDYGQFKYEQARKEKEARRHQRSVEFKEVRLRVKIGKGDFDTKVRRAISFLEAGDRVKVTVQFRGQSRLHRAGPPRPVRGFGGGLRQRRPSPDPGGSLHDHGPDLQPQTRCTGAQERRGCQRGRSIRRRRRREDRR
jgi:translation initiation factor IF-3